MLCNTLDTAIQSLICMSESTTKILASLTHQEKREF